MSNPDYYLKAMRASTQGTGREVKGKVGAGWKKADGAISIALDPFVTLENRDGDLVLMLFLVEETPTKIPYPKARR